MPQIFIALASILAWVLWICGMIMGFSVFIHGMVAGVIYGPKPSPMSVWAGFAVALGFGVGSVVVMVLRKKME